MPRERHPSAPPTSAPGHTPSAAPASSPRETKVDLVNPDPGQAGSASPHDGNASPRLPHERDQSTDAVGTAPDPQVEQAYKDVQRGLQDTDRGVAADQAYKKLKTSGKTAK